MVEGLIVSELCLRHYARHPIQFLAGLPTESEAFGLAVRLGRTAGGTREVGFAGLRLTMVKTGSFGG